MRKILNKKVLIIPLIVVVILILGIYPMLSKKNSASGKVNNAEEIKIYMLTGDDDFQNLITMFKSQYPKVKVNIITFDGYIEYKKKIANDIMSGDGPDVLWLRETTTNGLNRLERSGALLDLKPLMKKDKDFNAEDYNSKVIECGMYDNKQLFVPFNYAITSLISTTELLKKNNININEEMSQEQFLGALEPYMNSIKGQKGRVTFKDPISIEQLIAGSGLNLIDYSKKKVSFNNEKFIELAKKFKDIYLSSDYNHEITIKYNFAFNEMLSDGAIGFDQFSGAPSSISNIFKLISAKSNQAPVFTSAGERGIAFAGPCLAIAKNARNKEAAYNFIKIALSEKVQSNEGNAMTHGVPINKKGLKDMIKTFKANIDQGSNTTAGAVPKEFGDSYLDAVNNIKKCIFFDPAISGIINDGLMPYLEGRCSVESSAKEIDDKVNLYLNE